MTRARIKQIASEMFAEKGYEGTALSEIAGAIGIKTPSIYGHFQSKEQMLLEIWDDLVSDYRDLMERLLNEVEGNTAEEQIFGLVRGYGDYFRNHPQTYYLWARMLMFPPPAFREKTLRDCMAVEERVLGRISERFMAAVEQEEIRNAPIEDLLAAFAVLKEGYVQWLMFYGVEEADEQTRRLWPLLWHGLSMG